MSDSERIVKARENMQSILDEIEKVFKIDQEKFSLFRNMIRSIDSDKLSEEYVSSFEEKATIYLVATGAISSKPNFNR